MFDDLLTRLTQGLSLIQMGREVIAEVQDNIAEAKAVLSEQDLATLNAKLDEVTAESEALSARIQRA